MMRLVWGECTAKRVVWGGGVNVILSNQNNFIVEYDVKVCQKSLHFNAVFKIGVPLGIKRPRGLRQCIRIAALIGSTNKRVAHKCM